MNKWQAQVAAFHEATNQTVSDEPEIRDRELRARLIMEEAVETVAALGYTAEATIRNMDEQHEVSYFFREYLEPNFEDFIDGMCDLIYVVCGSAVAAGIDLENHFDEVHRANMTKLAGPKREDGKQLKPEGWQPPDHEKLLIRARNRIEEWKRLEATWSRT